MLLLGKIANRLDKEKEPSSKMEKTASELGLSPGKEKIGSLGTSLAKTNKLLIIKILKINPDVFHLLIVNPFQNIKVGSTANEIATSL